MTHYTAVMNKLATM